jgi:hypothetical protein
MKTQRRLASTRHPLGSFGLLLVGLVGRLAEHAHSGRTDHGRIKAFLARRAIDGIAIVGWTVDRLGDSMSPGSASRAARRDALAVAPRRRRKPA